MVDGVFKYISRRNLRKHHRFVWNIGTFAIFRSFLLFPYLCGKTAICCRDCCAQSSVQRGVSRSSMGRVFFRCNAEPVVEDARFVAVGHSFSLRDGHQFFGAGRRRHVSFAPFVVQLLSSMTARFSCFCLVQSAFDHPEPSL